MRRKRQTAALLLCVCLLFSACGPSRPGGAVMTERQSSSGSAAVKSFDPYRAPPMAVVAFHEDQAEGNAAVRIDLSAVSEGYVAVSARSESRLKFQVLKDDLTYTYNLSSDGTPSFFPLQCGDGRYLFRVMENIAESKYAQVYSVERSVKLLDEFQPFLRPSDYSNYNENSDCVLKAAELAVSCADQLELVSSVYEYVCKHIRYDHKKAAALQSGYLPDVDETLLTGKGICFDYAALAAAMLRSQGIPTKIIFGYVSPNNVYHAWNMFYTERSGWVTVSFEVDEKSWNRIDLTFSAGGADDQFVGDGSHYTDVYSY